MKKVYISPEMLDMGFQTEGILAMSIKEGSANKNEILAPDYGEEDDEDWGGEDPANDKVY